MALKLKIFMKSVIIKARLCALSNLQRVEFLACLLQFHGKVQEDVNPLGLNHGYLPSKTIEFISLSPLSNNMKYTIPKNNWLHVVPLLLLQAATKTKNHTVTLETHTINPPIWRKALTNPNTSFQERTTSKLKILKHSLLSDE